MDFESLDSLDSLDRLDDGDLLERFLAGKDEAAFEALVRRHGPMVARVCARMLDGADADDAFQATFLVLAQHAAALRKRGSVGPWLYGVAVRVSRKARSGEAARRRREREAGGEVMAQHQDSEARAREQALWREARPLLDEELEALPEKYRAPLVLCYLEGQSNEQAAAALGWTKGTLSGRLARARDLLRERLGRRGAVLSLGLLVGLLESEAHAAVAPALAGGTAKAAALVAAGQLPGAGTLTIQAKILYEGVMQMLYWTKVKAAAAVLAATMVVGTGAGVVVWQAQAAESKAPQTPQPQRVAEAPAQPVAGGDAAPAEAPAVPPVVFTLANHGQTVRVRVGERFNVTLRGEGLGAGWRGGNVPADASALLSNETPPEEVNAQHDYRQRSFTYCAVKPGTCTLEMDFVTPSETQGRFRGIAKLLKEFKLTVEIVDAPVFEKDGLQVFLKPAKPVFAAKEKLAFTLTYKNGSDKPLLLYDLAFVHAWSMKFTREGADGWWSKYVPFEWKRVPAATVQLDPGKTLEVAVDMSRYQYLRGGVELLRNAPVSDLMPGRYKVVFSLEIKADPAKTERPFPNWVGQIKTEPVAFEITAAAP